MYEKYNSFFLYRMYSGEKIKEKLDKIPLDAIKIRLPKILEDIIGEFYIVNQVDKYQIDGDLTSALIIMAIDEARKAQQRASWNSNKSLNKI